ncbi:MBL fold metallo-hydrolase [Aquamicrobium sp. NLF2-7]|uniref:MBL fold metallo-hydrolase n=1 Tax=Aquamicrobium sp. NLF2-7 TaxID=2918753 RepID=UPI001EFBBE93|nr:MBL fold metallo-hydrolase [Aquamicrobium sp. NLF2-7]
MEIAPVVPDRHVSGARITIIGHATVLIQICGVNIVTDPLWSERASPIGFVGPKRVSPPAVAFDDLPKIDVVLLSHNHYDHLDKATLRKLVARDQPLIITPLGNDTIVAAAAPFANIRAGDWWDRHRVSEDVEVTLVPAHHWSARGLRDRRMALWCGFAIRAKERLIYFAGDTAYGDGRIFRSIRQNLGSPDVALLPIGAYAPRWFMRSYHTDPDEAVTIMQDLGASQAIGIHWGVFRLSDEGRDAPRIALEEALVSRKGPGSRFLPAEPGYVWHLEG